MTFDEDLGDLGPEAKWAIVRQRRNALLTLSDWTQLADVPLDEASREAWRVHRRRLRDLTDGVATPEEIEFPVPPG